MTTFKKLPISKENSPTMTNSQVWLVLNKFISSIVIACYGLNHSTQFENRQVHGNDQPPNNDPKYRHNQRLNLLG